MLQLDNIWLLMLISLSSLVSRLSLSFSHTHSLSHTRSLSPFCCITISDDESISTRIPIARTRRRISPLLPMISQSMETLPLCSQVNCRDGLYYSVCFLNIRNHAE